MHELKNIATFVESVVTIIAFIIAGIWGWILFRLKRQKYPRANITHKIFHKSISPDKLLLNIIAEISNEGDVLLSIVSGTTRVQQVLPLLPEMSSKITKENKLVTGNNTKAEWPLLDDMERNWENGEIIEIEPGEKDQIVYDFVIDAEIETVIIYSYFKNKKKKNKDLGWNLTTVYELKENKLQK